eukprot:3444828-Pyramimonas_sp.AAC.1
MPARAAAAKHGRGALVMAGTLRCHAIELPVARGSWAFHEPWRLGKKWASAASSNKSWLEGAPPMNWRFKKQVTAAPSCP